MHISENVQNFIWSIHPILKRLITIPELNWFSVLNPIKDGHKVFFKFFY